jgi:CDP-diacylglycerol---glycerol-3-phosphate 3-phosphatidyltransferase
MTATDKMTTVDQQGTKCPAPSDPFELRALNLPNCITVSRLILAFILFALIGQQQWILSAALFAAAAATDALDGFLARRYGMVTTLGRILDPFVDKIIVCGAFIFLLAVGDASGVGPWMVLIVIGRELFITGLRSLLEQQGKDFSASLSGKIKMLMQCVAIEASLLFLWLNPPDRTAVPRFSLIRDVLLWLAVAFTLASGILYIRRASQLLRSR